jgi:pimeloyl-ACP methyl ester carboxylesterase
MARQFKLPDGRNIDYLVSGAKDGFPLVWIHGTPGAYIPPSSLPAVCEKKGVKVITLSRPGYGGSTRKKGGQVVDTVADIQALIEHLGVERCFVGGWSGGGMFPYLSLNIRQ